jgi:NAD-dependent dihydropyrimidine dehydrogenase PreA subunit
MKTDIYLKNVVTLLLAEERCTGCGMCVKVCPHAVFKISERKAHIVNRDYCMECGACAMNCEKQAITVKQGVGCAAGVINGILKNTEPTCGCSSDKAGCC